jgi:GcrA cell cycle regulator
MQTASSDFDWNDTTIGRLRALWAEGHSTAEIGRCLGTSKNAVVGKSHRLSLTARPSPIRRDGTKQPRVRRPRCPSLTELQARATQAPAPKPPAPQPDKKPAPNLASALHAIPVIRPVDVPRGKQPCCWPIGEPGRSGFRFCDVPNVEGKPYCPEHCNLAYPKWRTSQAVA